MAEWTQLDEDVTLDEFSNAPLEKRLEMLTKIATATKSLNDIMSAAMATEITYNNTIKEIEGRTEARRIKIQARQDKLKKERDNQSKKDQAKTDKELKALDEKLKKLQKQADLEKAIAGWKKEQADAEEERQNNLDDANAILNAGWKKAGIGNSLKASWTKWVGGKTGGAGVMQGIDNIIHGLGSLAKQLNSNIETVAGYKGKWDTRLLGTSGSNHSSISEAVRNGVGVTPYVKQASLMENINQAITSGIAYNIEQRAFLQTIKEEIADTFDAFDSNLLNIIRLQQEDSTGARLGMEASLNQYLNSHYQDTSYLNGTRASVTNAFSDAFALLSADKSIEMEYQAQKWLGSLYSVGMSNGTITGIAEALNKLASGDTSGTDSGLGRLLVMAASRSSGGNYSDMLKDGLDGSEMNELLKSMVEYLQVIAVESAGNNVVMNKYAEVFGLGVSDIKAAANLGKSIGDIAKSGKGYSGGSGLGSLRDLMSSIGSRMSMGQLMGNLKDNFNYSMAAGIADNPALYLTWTLAETLDGLAKGINIPTILGMGTGVGLNATVADLMRIGAMSGSIFTGIGGMLGGLGSIGKGVGGIYDNLGKTASASVVRGAGFGANNLESTSESMFNSDGGGAKDSAFGEVANQKAAADDEISEKVEEIKLMDIHTDITAIYELLNGVIQGGRIKVSELTFDNFGA